MCGPSSALKAINSQIQDFSKQVTSEATTVFGDANTVFNNMIGGLQQQVQGGPSQEGFSAAELSARNAAAVNAGAAEARNLKGAAASGTAAIGGGNTVNPSGSTQATTLGAEQKAASDTAGAENEIVNEDYAQGNKNYEFATQAEQNLPNVFNGVTAFNKEAGDEQQTAQKSQQSIDTANNWWKPLVSSAIGAGVGALTGGLGGGLAKNLVGGALGENAPGGGGSSIMSGGDEGEVDEEGDVLG